MVWLRKAAEQGDARAQVNLGGMYHFGRGVPQDDVQSMYWYHKAAEQGDIVAQQVLFQLYKTGAVVPPDRSQEIDRLKAAAEQGNVQAIYNLGLLYEFGEGVPENREEAFLFPVNSVHIRQHPDFIRSASLQVEEFVLCFHSGHPLKRILCSDHRLRAVL